MEWIAMKMQGCKYIFFKLNWQAFRKKLIFKSKRHNFQTQISYAICPDWAEHV